MFSSVFLFVPGDAWISRTPLGLGARILRPLCPECPDVRRTLDELATPMSARHIARK
ncbi:hypothetical protein E4U57_006462, partial [Claviceps arundinis]